MSDQQLNSSEMKMLKEFLEKDIRYMRGLVDAAKENNVAKANETRKAISELKKEISDEIKVRDLEIGTLKSKMFGKLEVLRLDFETFKVSIMTREDMERTALKTWLFMLPPYAGLIISIVLLIRTLST